MLHKAHVMYVNPADESLDTHGVAAAIAAALSGCVKQNVAYDDFSIFETLKNESFDPHEVTKRHDFTTSKFRVNVEARNDVVSINEKSFQEIVTRVIISLRAREMLVVIVGDLEEIISEITGWNWIDTNQIQPGL